MLESARRPLRPLLAAILLVGGARVALAADAQLVSLGAGASVQGTIGTSSRSLSFAGIFNLSIDGGALTQGYCIDIAHSIHVGDTVPQVPPISPCDVVYVLGHFYPQAAPVLTAAKEAAAVQSAIWFFTDGFHATSPSDIAARADQVVVAAQGQCALVPAVPSSITVTPATATSSLPADTMHTVTATLRDTNGQAIPQYPIRVEVAGAAGPKVFNGTTDAGGSYTVTYTNDFAVTGADTITASVTFTVPVGQEFKSPDKQGIVLAGGPRTGSVEGTATHSWVVATCGDGRTNQAGEECDDGNLVSGDGCDANCTVTRCGNAIRTAGEECDDGNPTNGDGCDANCKTTRCGNGVVTAGEQCDDGNLVDGDGCDSNCTPTRCGNGVRSGTEQCDDGNAVNGDGCDTNCTLTACGNGIRTAGEECDDGNPTSGDGCDANCTATRCGNGVRTAGEECDDGNLASGDGCDANCTVSRCGNGIVAGGEQCDDGNLVSGDACDSNCTFPGCGNGVRAGNEQCDDGNQISGDGCDSNCRPTGCGNGVRTAGELCDDGNLVSGDGCDANCRPTGCGNGVRTAGEQCDDGNLVDGDGCDSNCTATACGNGIVTAGEECDDGNLVDGDGCQADCTIQTCGNGIVDPGEECDDGNLLNGDGCSDTCRRQEICGDLEDEDGDGLYDCEDPDCIDVQHPIYRDPGDIKFYVDDRPDRFRIKGGIPLSSTAVIDPPTERIGILVTNTHAVLFKQWLEVGAFPEGRPSNTATWKHFDRQTKFDGGVFQFNIGKVPGIRDRHPIRLKLYSDLSLAIEPTMAVQIVVGTDLFCEKASWTARPSGGWRLPIHDKAP